MLRFLDVRRLAVIDQLQVEFEPGLNIITGETGAGKSVLVEAIDLLLGGRASADLVRTGETTAVVQAVFERPDRAETMVRREISAEGRSRAFLDEALTTTSALREFARPLVDLHGQHEHQALLDPINHGLVLDAFIDEPIRLADLASTFDAWRQAAASLSRRTMDAREKRGRIELASYHKQEIDKVAPEAGEDERLDAERTVLANADRLDRLSSEAYDALYDAEHSALGALATVWKRVEALAALDTSWREHLDRREGVKAALEDLAHGLREYRSGLNAAPGRLEVVEDRRAVLERLKRKYGPTLANVLSYRTTLAEELAALEATDEQASTLEAHERTSREAFLSLAKEWSSIRTKAARRLEGELERSLAELAMPKAVFNVRIQPSEQAEHWTARGIDRVEFYLSANPGEEARPLGRIASGGELSRVMLALQTLADTGARGRTLIFDEVDAGIGGVTADAVGAKLSALARRHQVICITHLAQVAARPGAHFHIAKAVRGGRTITTLARLDRAGREAELGRMIAGADASDLVLGSARELLEKRGESEEKTKGESPAGRKAKGRHRDA